MRDLLYHYTSGKYLRQILDANRITGETAHDFPYGRQYGVSLSRDRNLNLMKTYAISGQKPFRLGLDRALLAQRHRIVPYRDGYLQGVHKASQQYCGVLSRIECRTVRTDTNEAEEFLLNEIKPVLKYLVEIAVNSEAIIDDTDEFNGNENVQTYWDIRAGTFKVYHDELEVMDEIQLPESVVFLDIDNERPHPRTDQAHRRAA